MINKWAGRLTGILILVLTLVLAGCHTERTSLGVLLQETVSGSGEETEPEQQPEEETATTAAPGILVYVCGCVKEPGVYELSTDARVQDAVAAAGGFDRKADNEYWNLAETVRDGEQIRIPSREEGEKLREKADTGGSRLVNLNTATKEELMTLKGIGEAKADAIIHYRETQGPFEAIEDVMLVTGIKEAAFRKIRDSITV